MRKNKPKVKIFSDEDVTWTVCPNCKKAVYGTSKWSAEINWTAGKKKHSWKKGG